MVSLVLLFLMFDIVYSNQIKENDSSIIPNICCVKLFCFWLLYYVSRSRLNLIRWIDHYVSITIECVNYSSGSLRAIKPKIRIDLSNFNNIYLWCNYHPPKQAWRFPVSCFTVMSNKYFYIVTFEFVLLETVKKNQIFSKLRNSSGSFISNVFSEIRLLTSVTMHFICTGA